MNTPSTPSEGRPSSTSTLNDDSSSEDSEDDSPGGKGKYPKRRVDYRDLAQLFFLPENEAAEKLAISKSKLKRLKKKKSIQRWPYRRLQSIQKKIESNNELMKRLQVESEIVDVQTQNSELQSTINFILSWPNSISKFSNEDIQQIVKQRTRISIPNLLNPLIIDDKSDEEN